MPTAPCVEREVRLALDNSPLDVLRLADFIPDGDFSSLKDIGLEPSVDAVDRIPVCEIKEGISAVEVQNESPRPSTAA